MFTEQINTLMNRLENILLAFFAEKHISGVTIEKYRWDEPCITASWMSRDNISRNIVFGIENDGCTIQSETNAWIDDTIALRRRYTHKMFGTVQTKTLTETGLKTLLEKIFTASMQVTENDLTNNSDLSPLP